MEAATDRMPMRVLVFSASHREASLNTRLARLAIEALEATDVEVDAATMADFDCVSYDGDLEASVGIPEPAQEFARRIEGSDGFIICSPEYNSSMPGVLKNAIDWTSRLKPQPFAAAHCLLMSASPSMVGGNRSLWSLRQPLEHLGTRVHPDMFSLAQAHTAFGDDGQLANEQLGGRLRGLVTAWVDVVEATKHYPCAKARWVEFLGEHPEPVLDRVQ
ncbi:MAG: NADPH:quinone oxidoreductase [Thermoleophilia bacterium]|nr:NADPH:quinone oxidoreductase [Thermoleophilia bacterium]